MIKRPLITLPDDARDIVTQHYESADVILEYGSGGSTVLASEMPRKQIFSVEADKTWAQDMQSYLDQADQSVSTVALHVVDIGQTGRWSKPVSDKSWREYWKYSLSVWQRDDFVQPDIILVDGIFRPACVVAAMLMAQKKTPLLFDDYYNPRTGYDSVRPRFSFLEDIIRPVEQIGRMARFDIVPDALPREFIPLAIGSFFRYF